MNKREHVFLAGLVLIGMIFFFAGCVEPQGDGGNQPSQQPVSSRGESRQQSQSIDRQTDEMIRRVNSIIENIGSVDERIQEAGTTILEEKEMLDRIKQNAKTAYLGGQITDFRMWQRIGRDKMTNIENTVRKMENTIHVARQNAESDLRRVNWISKGEKNKHQSQIDQKLLQLDAWMTKIGQVVSDLDLQHAWLNENE